MNELLRFSSLSLYNDPIVIIGLTSGIVLIALIAIVVVLLMQGAVRSREEEQRRSQARIAEAEMAELKGRLSFMAQMTAERQSDLARSLNERLDRVTQHLGASVEETGRRTAENLSRLNERLAIIDTAQKNITELSGKVVTLQDILANKQTRGAFGQVRMEAIIEDGLPADSFKFQATLSNGKRPDCLVSLPNSPACIVIDAKFPLESFETLRHARTDPDRTIALKRVRVDVGKHIDDMTAKYFIPGETQDTAMLFVPAESVYAELHEVFPDLIQKAHRARIVIVSPNMLMLAVQTMMAIMKDVRMREQAHVIQREVGTLLEDVKRLRDRVLDLQKHFGQLAPDVDKILISADKIASRGRRIEGLELKENQKENQSANSSSILTAAE